MKAFSLKPALMAVVAAALLAGCSETVREGTYQTNPRGGWDNFRAERPVVPPEQRA
jgi:hypothetical protein